MMHHALLLIFMCVSASRKIASLGNSCGHACCPIGSGDISSFFRRRKWMGHVNLVRKVEPNSQEIKLQYTKQAKKNDDNDDE